jgi:TetR/AcrR family transcriptional regulator, transcriptional repressor of aconitase
MEPQYNREIAFMKKRLTRQESRTLTQEKLLGAAAKIFARRGFGGTSIEEIAETAGFSRGAFHANFKSKDALFLSLVEQQVKMLTSQIRELLAASQSAEETLKNLRAAYTYFTGADKDAFLLLTEAQLYALRNPRFGKKLSSLFSAIHDELIASVKKFQENIKSKDSVGAERLVLIGFALSHGLTLYNLMDPERYSDAAVSDSSRVVFDRIFPKTE